MNVASKVSVTGKLNAGMSKFTRGMKNGVANCKVDGKIAEQQKKIKALTKEIGNLTLVRLRAGDEMCPEIMERYEAIQEAEERIDKLENSKTTTKITCASCGTKNDAEMNYCGKCGVSIKRQ